MQSHYKQMITFLWVLDLPRAVRFYTEVLGLNKVFDSDGWCELALPGTRNAYLALNRWTPHWDSPHNGFVTFGIDNLDDFKEHLRAKEVRLKDDTIVLHDHGLRLLKFYDPDGNILTLAEVQRT